MSEPAPLSIAVVAEARADQEIACDLADRVLCEEIGWLEIDLLDGVRQWRGHRDGVSFIPWTRVPDLARAQHIKAHGHFGGRPGEPDARNARLALLFLISLKQPPAAVLLIRDTDGDPRRQVGLEQARQDTKCRFAVILGVAHPKRECWVLAGFQPQGTAERRRFSAARRELYFDPCTQSAKLTAKGPTAKGNAKQVLASLVGQDRERERRCWQETDLATLEDRGEHTGLRAYLDEIRERLVPLVVAD